MSKKQKEDLTKRICHDCAHHYDEHDRAKDGRMILCRCPYHKFSRLQYYAPDSCERFARDINI